MTTDGIIEFKRDIDTLLSLDTYQGMTDAEIDSLIEYHSKVAARDARIEERNDAQLVASLQMQQAQMERVETAQRVLESMLEIEIPWVRVGDM